MSWDQAVGCTGPACPALWGHQLQSEADGPGCCPLHAGMGSPHKDAVGPLLNKPGTPSSRRSECGVPPGTLPPCYKTLDSCSKCWVLAVGQALGRAEPGRPHSS